MGPGRNGRGGSPITTSGYSFAGQYSGGIAVRHRQFPIDCDLSDGCCRGWWVLERRQVVDSAAIEHHDIGNVARLDLASTGQPEAAREISGCVEGLFELNAVPTA